MWFVPKTSRGRPLALKPVATAVTEWLLIEPLPQKQKIGR